MCVCVCVCVCVCACVCMFAYARSRMCTRFNRVFVLCDQGDWFLCLIPLVSLTFSLFLSKNE